MKNFICTVLMILMCTGLSYGQGINFRTSVTQSTFSDEQWPGAKPHHPGYFAGFDVVIADGAGFIMPGLYFQKLSLFPEQQNWKSPYAEYTDIKLLKLPVQIGGYIFDSKVADLRLHGGVIANFLIGMDTNDKLVEEDLNDVRGGFILGASARILFLTVHVNYEYGISRIYFEDNPSGIQDKSKERVLSFGLGLYF